MHNIYIRLSVSAITRKFLTEYLIPNNSVIYMGFHENPDIRSVITQIPLQTIPL